MIYGTVILDGFLINDNIIENTESNFVYDF